MRSFDASGKNNLKKGISACSSSGPGLKREGMVGFLEGPGVIAKLRIHAFQAVLDPSFGHEAVDGVDRRLAGEFGTEEFEDVHSRRKLASRFFPSVVRMDSG